MIKKLEVVEWVQTSELFAFRFTHVWCRGGQKDQNVITQAVYFGLTTSSNWKPVLPLSCAYLFRLGHAISVFGCPRSAWVRNSSTQDAPLPDGRPRSCRCLDQPNWMRKKNGFNNLFAETSGGTGWGVEYLQSVLIAVLKATGRIRYKNGWFCERISSRVVWIKKSLFQPLKIYNAGNHFGQWQSGRRDGN